MCHNLALAASQFGFGCVTVWLRLRHRLALVVSQFGFGCVFVLFCLFFASQFGFDCVSLVLAACLSVCLFISAFVFLCLFACFSFVFLFVALVVFTASQIGFGRVIIWLPQFDSGCVTAWLRHSLTVAASQFGFGCGLLLNLVPEQTTQNFATDTFGNLLSELHPSSQPHVGRHVVCRKGEQTLDYTSASPPPPPLPPPPPTLPAFTCMYLGTLSAGTVNNH